MVATIQLSNVADGKINVPVVVTAKITSTVGIKNIEWLANKPVHFVISTDQKTYRFTPSENGEYVFTVTVWENDGQRVSAGSRVIVGSVVPTPIPEPPQPAPEPVPQPGTGQILWDSNIHGKWNNGKARTMTGHHEFDPFDPLTECAAGENRKWTVNGDGTSTNSGARTRIYNHVVQQAGVRYQYEVDYIHNSSLDNLSFQLFSRHNEGDPEVNRTGGPTYAFHNSNIEFDHEYWHNERDSSLAKSHTLINKIPNGVATKLKIISTKTVSGDQVSFKSEIFVNGKPEWTHTFNSNHDKASINKSLYWRWRFNGDNPQNVKVLHSRITQL